jgi:hypothetical protein
MEFKFTEIARFKYRIRIDVPTLPGEEMEKTYEELREIQETIKPFNPSAAALFPVYRLWLPIQVNLSPTLDALPFQLLSRLPPSQCAAPFLRLKQLSEECHNWRSVSEEDYWLRPVRNYLTAAGGSLDRIITLEEVSLYSISFFFSHCRSHRTLTVC